MKIKFFLMTLIVLSACKINKVGTYDSVKDIFSIQESIYYYSDLKVVTQFFYIDEDSNFLFVNTIPFLQEYYSGKILSYVENSVFIRIDSYHKYYFEIDSTYCFNNQEQIELKYNNAYLFSDEERLMSFSLQLSKIDSFNETRDLFIKEINYLDSICY